MLFRSKKAARRVLALVALAVVVSIALVAGFWFYTHAGPVVEMRGTAVSILAWPPRSIPVNDITGLSLESSLGEGSRYVQSPRPPYVKLQTRSGVVYVNYSEPARTRELYERLTRELNK